MPKIRGGTALYAPTVRRRNPRGPRRGRLCPAFSRLASRIRRRRWQAGMASRSSHGAMGHRRPRRASGRSHWTPGPLRPCATGAARGRLRRSRPVRSTRTKTLSSARPTAAALTPTWSAWPLSVWSARQDCRASASTTCATPTRRWTGRAHPPQGHVGAPGPQFDHDHA